MKRFTYLIQVFALMLFSAFSASMAVSAPMSISKITYFQSKITHFAQANDVGFAAREPPLAVFNVASAGGVTVMYGSAFALHGQETVAALFGFGGDLIVTNKTLDVPNSSIDVNISNADLALIDIIPPGQSSTVSINGASTLITKGPDGK